MNRRPWVLKPRSVVLAGIVLLLSSGYLYRLHRVGQRYADAIQWAEQAYQSGQYADAITAYQAVLQRSTALENQLNARLFGPRIHPDRVQLHIANSHYRQAKAELLRYQDAVNDPRATARPALAAVHHAFSTAINLYDQISQRDPLAYIAAQTNATRAAAWQLLLTATHGSTPGQRSLSQLTERTIKRAAQAVENAHQHRAEIDRESWMTAILLLETLTTFSQTPESPSRGLDTYRNPPMALGDLLRREEPELNDDERRRFEDFFFARPLEADNPWPTTGSARPGRQPDIH